MGGGGASGKIEYFPTNCQLLFEVKFPQAFKYEIRKRKNDVFMQCISYQKIQNITLRTINSLSSKIFIKSGIKFNSFMLNMMLAKSWQQKV